MRLPVRRASAATALAILLSVLVAAQAVAMTWNPKVRLTKSGSGDAGGLVTLGPSTAVAIYDSGPYVYVRRSTDGGLNWASKLRLSDVDASAWFSAIDGRGTAIDAVWHEQNSTLNNSSVRYRRSTTSGASFGPSVALTTLAWDDVAVPDVAHGPDDVVAVAWHEINSDTIRVRVSIDGGMSFAPEQILANISSTWIRPPAVAVGDDVIYVAYFIDDDSVRLRRSRDNGATWQSPVKIANNAALDLNVQALSMTAAGRRAYVAFTVDDLSSTWIRYRRTTSRGGTWSGQMDLSPSSANPAIVPEVKLQGGVLRAVYEQCDTPPSPGCNGSAVMFRSSPDGVSWSAPAQASHPATDWATPAGVGFAGRVVVLYTADNGGTSPFEPNTDVFVRTGT